ncbi:MAG: NADP-dependent malic enzyme, partial [Bdellovibrionales bacterium]|nr:NADP-dependent malic enzyme [Bdellovibrionales bacterium]
ATGRSDFPNQVNNVLGFPFIFRGALDVHARRINEDMKVAASLALAQLAREDVPESVFRAYGNKPFSFGREYIIPKPFDHRVLLYVAPAVARAAIDSGVSRVEIGDADEWIKQYKKSLQKRLGRHMSIMRGVHERASATPRRIVFPEGEHEKILLAAKQLINEGFAHPVLVGGRNVIEGWAAAHELDLAKVTIVDPLQNEHHKLLAGKLHELRSRNGVTQSEASHLLKSNGVVLGSMLVREGLADGMVTGADMHYPDSLRPVMQLLYGKGKGAARAAGVYALFVGNRTLFLADTTVNSRPTAQDLAECAQGAARLARQFGYEPRVAMLSHSNFGSSVDDSVLRVREAVRLLHEQGVDFQVDGEMQADTAVCPEIVDDVFPFCEIKGAANVLVFPDLQSANICYKLLQRVGGAEAIGPILVGMNKPINVLQRSASVDEIVNMAMFTVLEIQQMTKKEEPAPTKKRAAKRKN